MLTIIATSFAITVSASPALRNFAITETDEETSSIVEQVDSQPASFPALPVSMPTVQKAGSPIAGKAAAAPSMSVFGVTSLIALVVSIPVVQWRWARRKQCRGFTVAKQAAANSSNLLNSESRMSRMFGPSS